MEIRCPLIHLPVRISQQQLESYLWGVATLLRGTIDAGDYKQFIFPLLFYSACATYSMRRRRPR
jgi:type I restriction-modification system DNA methylase subunit